MQNVIKAVSSAFTRYDVLIIFLLLSIPAYIVSYFTSSYVAGLTLDYLMYIIFSDISTFLLYLAIFVLGMYLSSLPFVYAVNSLEGRNKFSGLLRYFLFGLFLSFSALVIIMLSSFSIVASLLLVAVFIIFLLLVPRLFYLPYLVVTESRIKDAFSKSFELSANNYLKLSLVILVMLALVFILSVLFVLITTFISISDIVIEIVSAIISIYVTFFYINYSYLSKK